MAEEELPFVAFGNDELDAAPPVGDTIECPHCGETHPLERSYGEPRTPGREMFLDFYKCGETTYLAGVMGKDVTGRFR